MKNLHTFEEFVNEAKKVDVTYTTDPKSLLAFNESKGPYKVGMAIFGPKDDTECVVFPHLGDRGLNMTVSGPGFRAKWAKELGIDESLYKQMNFNIGKDEFVDLAKKSGFKKTRGEDYEMDVKNPEEALKIIIKFFKPIVDKITNK